MTARACARGLPCPLSGRAWGGRLSLGRAECKGREMLYLSLVYLALCIVPTLWGKCERQCRLFYSLGEV